MPRWGEVLELLRQLGQPKESQPHDVVRREFLSRMYEYTGRNLILYSSGWTHLLQPVQGTSISEADLQGFMETIHGLEGDELDLIVHSPGGSPDTTESLVDYLRSKFNSIRMIVPHAAMSAATLMCCSADEIVMGRHSSLGPIDPQITLETPTGIRSVPAQAILRQFDQAAEELDDDPDRLAQWSPILRQYGPSLLVECEQAVSLSEELAEEWAKEYMFSSLEDEQAQTRANEIAATLSDWDEFKSHSRHINREKAKEYGFKISNLEEDQELQDIVLTIYHLTTLTHIQNGVAKIIENHMGNAFVQSGGDSGGGGNQGGPEAEIIPTDQNIPPGPPQEPE